MVKPLWLKANALLYSSAVCVGTSPAHRTIEHACDGKNGKLRHKKTTYDDDDDDENSHNIPYIMTMVTTPTGTAGTLVDLQRGLDEAPRWLSLSCELRCRMKGASRTLQLSLHFHRCEQTLDGGLRG